MQETMNLLESAGFGLYSHDSNVLTSTVSAPLSPVSSDSAQSDTGSQPNAPTSKDKSGSETPSPVRTPGLCTERSTRQEPDTPHPIDASKPSPVPRNQSHSPTSGEVHALSPDLACVGLSDDNIDRWALKIVKLVAFPELIDHTPSSSTTTMNDFSLDDLVSIRGQVPTTEPISPVSPSVARGRPSFSSSVSTSSSSDDDGYFSHSPTGNNSSSSLVTSAPSRSCTDLSNLAATTATSCKPPSMHRLATGLSVVPPKNDADVCYARRVNIINHRPPQQTWSGGGGGATMVPFFSFTRTAEGSSLTTDVSLLAALFPPHERYMVSCSGELDAVGDRDTNAVELSDEDEDDQSASSTLRCLQIDLRRFGLGKFDFPIDVTSFI